MRILVLPLGLAAFLFSASALSQTSGGEPPLTLAQAQALAASRSFAIRAAQREVEAQAGVLGQAGAYRNPTLNASVEDTQRATRTTTATVDIPLELGGKRAARLGLARRSQELAEAELRQVRAQLRAEVVRAFFAVLVAQERVALADDSARLAARSADAVGKRVLAGKTSPVDEGRARVDLANVQLEAAEAAGELALARHELAALWNEPAPAFPNAEGTVDAALADVGTAGWVREIDSAPALLASRVEAERRRAVVEVERSRAVADVTLSLGVKRDNDLGRTQAVFGVSVPLPLFDRNQGAIHEASQRAEKAFDEYQLARSRLLGELQSAAARLEVARASARTLQDTVLPAARQNHLAATRGFEAGKFGLLDVVDAQRALLQSRLRYLAALSTTHQAAAAIDRLLGR